MTLSAELRAAVIRACEVASTADGDKPVSEESERSVSPVGSRGGVSEPNEGLAPKTPAPAQSLARTQQAPSRGMSPRLDYGLWVDPETLIRVIEPPVDIMPYLGNGMTTLAGCIFWSAMNYTIDLWNSRSAPLSSKRLDYMFNHSKHLTDRDFLISLAQARLDYKEKGYMYAKLTEQFERNAMSRLFQLVKSDYDRQKQPSRWWKRPEEVAACIFDEMNPSQRARFQDVIDGKGTKADQDYMRPLITWLSQNFICFGDGPRWSSIFVSVAIGSWLNELNAQEAAALQ